MLSTGEGSRLQQMVDWLGGEGFAGALVFDECHRAKNCIAKQAAMGRKQNESKTSRVTPTCPLSTITQHQTIICLHDIQAPNWHCMSLNRYKSTMSWRDSMQCCEA